MKRMLNLRLRNQSTKHSTRMLLRLKRYLQYKDTLFATGLSTHQPSAGRLAMRFKLSVEQIKDLDNCSWFGSFGPVDENILCPKGRMYFLRTNAYNYSFIKLYQFRFCTPTYKKKKHSST